MERKERRGKGGIRDEGSLVVPAAASRYHGARGVFEVVKPAKYKAARELTCDNVGLVAAGDLEAAKTVLKKLCVGKRLFSGLSEQALVDEAETIFSGLVGWFVRRHLTYPPAGARLMNLEEFAREV